MAIWWVYWVWSLCWEVISALRETSFLVREIEWNGLMWSTEGSSFPVMGASMVFVSREDGLVGETDTPFNSGSCASPAHFNSRGKFSRLWVRDAYLISSSSEYPSGSIESPCALWDRGTQSDGRDPGEAFQACSFCTPSPALNLVWINASRLLEKAWMGGLLAIVCLFTEDG